MYYVGYNCVVCNFYFGLSYSTSEFEYLDEIETHTD